MKIFVKKMGNKWRVVTPPDMEGAGRQVDIFGWYGSLSDALNMIPDGFQHLGYTEPVDVIEYIEDEGIEVTDGAMSRIRAQVEVWLDHADVIVEAFGHFPTHDSILWKGKKEAYRNILDFLDDK